MTQAQYEVDKANNEANKEHVANSEKKLRQLDRRDKAMRIFEILVLLGLVLFTLLAILKLDNIAQSNLGNTEENAIANEEVHDEIKSYIKCILLIPRAKNEPFTEQQLDNCAENVNDNKRDN